MEAHLKDREEVRALIQLYIDGSNGEVDKLKKAFHADARIDLEPSDGCDGR